MKFNFGDFAITFFGFVASVTFRSSWCTDFASLLPKSFFFQISRGKTLILFISFFCGTSLSISFSIDNISALVD